MFKYPKKFRFCLSNQIKSNQIKEKKMFSILIGSIFSMVFSKVLSMDHPQSHMYLSGEGFTYEPKDDADWLDHSITSSLFECVIKCNLDYKCRTFVYNAEPNHCHLYQVEPDEKQIVPSGSSTLGYVRLTADLYLSYNKTCQFCEQDRYLFCYQDYCRCPWNSFWNGFICEKQRYAMELCSRNDQCRDNPYNLKCNQANIFIPNSEDFPPTVQICSQNTTNLILNINGTTLMSYFPTNFTFQARTTSIAITFLFLDHFGYWLLDDVQLINLNENVDVIRNGNFEEGNLKYWNYFQANNVTSTVMLNSSLYPSKNGSYSFSAGPKPKKDYLTQIIPTKINDFYQFSFWLSHSTASSNSSATVTLVY